MLSPLPSALLSLDPKISLDALPDRLFFHHFRTIAVPDFVRLVGPDDFWTAHVLPLCSVEPAVLYAAVAVGAAHSMYLADSNIRKEDPKGRSSPGCAAVAHYNNSIHRILEHSRASNGNAQDLGAILVCCILFVCLENLLGHPEEALRHMRAGAALLNTIDLTAPYHPGFVPEPIQSPGTAGDSHTALNTILRASATVLSRFGIDASILQEEHAIPDIRPYAAPPQPVGDPSRPFASLRDAKETIWDLDARMSWLHLSSPDAIAQLDQFTYTLGQGEDPMRFSPAWARLQADFRRWSSRLNHTMAAAAHSEAQAPSPELRERLMMSLRHRMWDVIAADESRLPMICDATLNTVEHVYEVEQALAPRPVFTLDCDTIPLLVMLASWDETLTPRILALLRRYRRREGLLDSTRVADKMEAWSREVTEQTNFPSWILSSLGRSTAGCRDPG